MTYFQAYSSDSLSKFDYRLNSLNFSILALYSDSFPFQAQLVLLIFSKLDDVRSSRNSFDEQIIQTRPLHSFVSPC